jgi:hypothetical protein
MTKRFKWASNAADNIDWYSHGRTLQAYNFYQMNFSVKFIHEWLPLNGVKFHQSTTDQCPCCKEKKETFDHFITCVQNPELYQNLQECLVEVYQKHTVDPVLCILPIQDGKVQGLYPLLDFEPYETLIDAQTKIGWNQVRFGRYALDWEKILLWSTWHRSIWRTKMDTSHYAHNFSIQETKSCTGKIGRTSQAQWQRMLY